MNNVEAPNEAPACADGEGAPDEDLFKEAPPRDECPICMLSLPVNQGETTHYACCGKVICRGCVHAHRTADNRCLCPFCRSPTHTSDVELIERFKKREEADDAEAIYRLGCYYRRGVYGLPRDHNKAMELWLRAGELGCPRAYCSIGFAYDTGRGVGRDVKKAKHYYELAVMKGDILARHNLGVLEERAGNMDRAVKHWMISAGAGFDESLDAIRGFFLNGHATKDDFEKALRAHKESKDEMTSVQRQAAAAARGLN